MKFTNCVVFVALTFGSHCHVLTFLLLHFFCGFDFAVAQRLCLSGATVDRDRHLFVLLCRAKSSDVTALCCASIPLLIFTRAGVSVYELYLQSSRDGHRPLSPRELITWNLSPIAFPVKAYAVPLKLAWFQPSTTALATPTREPLGASAITKLIRVPRSSS